MKYFIMVLSIVAMSASAQEMQCVEVPKDHKIVFVPWIIPAGQLRWTWRAAKEVDVEEPEPVVVECDTGELVVSPSVCSP